MSFLNGLDLLVQAASLRSDNESTRQLNNYPVLPKKRPFSLSMVDDSSDSKSDLSDGKLIMDLDEEESKSINLDNSIIDLSTNQQNFYNSTNLSNITTLINASIKKNQSNNLKKTTTIADSNTTTGSNSSTLSFKLKDGKSESKITRPKRTSKPTAKFELSLKENTKRRSSLSRNDDNLDEEIKNIVQDIQTSRKKATKTPDELKDEEYILKRKKNNIAAKKSREQKNAKIKEIRELYEYLDHENIKLKEELFHEISLMGLLKKKMNKSPKIKDDVLNAIKENDNLSIYEKLIDFEFNFDDDNDGDDENKENQ